MVPLILKLLRPLLDLSGLSSKGRLISICNIQNPRSRCAFQEGNFHPLRGMESDATVRVPESAWARACCRSGEGARLPKSRRQNAERIPYAAKPSEGAFVPGEPTGSRARQRPQTEPRQKRASPRTESSRQQDATPRYREGHAKLRRSPRWLLWLVVPPEIPRRGFQIDYRYGSHTVFKVQRRLVRVTKYLFRVVGSDDPQWARELLHRTCEGFDVRILKGG